MNGTFLKVLLLDNLGIPVHASSIGNLITTTTTGSELQCSAQARPVIFVVVVSSTTTNKVQSRRELLRGS